MFSCRTICRWLIVAAWAAVITLQPLISTAHAKENPAGAPPPVMQQFVDDHQISGAVTLVAEHGQAGHLGAGRHGRLGDSRRRWRPTRCSASCR